jgi:nucleoside-diphosphate-sugar epimerase
VNIGGTEILASLIDRKRHRTVYASTGSCYGSVDSICTEETRISPLSLYGESKARGEEVLLGVDAVILRLATLFGLSPRPRFDLLINCLTEEAVKKKHISIYEANFKRTFLHVRDAAAAFIFALENFGIMSRNIFNVGDEGMNMTKGEAVFKIQSILPETVIQLNNDGEDKDKRDYHVSYSKISKLGFTSRYSLEDGILELIKIIPSMSSREIEFYRNL